MTDPGDNRWVVVARKSRMPVSRHRTLKDAADRIVRDKTFGTCTVMKQGRYASMPMVELTHEERKRLERMLFPALFDQVDDD